MALKIMPHGRLQERVAEEKGCFTSSSHPPAAQAPCDEAVLT
jgi:hypothetical protein